MAKKEKSMKTLSLFWRAIQKKWRSFSRRTPACARDSRILSSFRIMQIGSRRKSQCLRKTPFITLKTPIFPLRKGEHTAFLYADYNYENIEDTDCLPAVTKLINNRHLFRLIPLLLKYFHIPSQGCRIAEGSILLPSLILTVSLQIWETGAVR